MARLEYRCKKEKSCLELKILFITLAVCDSGKAGFIQKPGGKNQQEGLRLFFISFTKPDAGDI